MREMRLNHEPCKSRQQPITYSGPAHFAPNITSPKPLREYLDDVAAGMQPIGNAEQRPEHVIFG